MKFIKNSSLNRFYEILYNNEHEIKSYERLLWK